MGELGRAGGQAGMGRKMGRECKGGLEEEATVRNCCKALPYGGPGGGVNFRVEINVGPGCTITPPGRSGGTSLPDNT